ncbi:MAG: metallopeptidase family protein [Chloroflexota bacterium]|nr:metallopeptidase family protein [Chloroflexota bacterium]
MILVKLGMVRTARNVAQKARLQRFHSLVSRVVRELPADVRQLIDNVAIVVEEEPLPEHFEDTDADDGDELFGLYQGIPRTDRGSSYSLVTPDRIIIFAGPLERACGSRREFEDQIRITVLHELGHHLGFDEAGLDVIGLS